jgi:hypothetical protein
MDLEQRETPLLRTARHEIVHAALASEYFGAHCVDWVRLSARGALRGETAWHPPFPPALLAWRYRRDPEGAMASLQRVIATIDGPRIALSLPPTAAEVACDQEHLADWRAAWEALHAPPMPWRFLAAGAHLDVQRWLAAPGRAADLAIAAELLVEAGRFSRRGWQALAAAIAEPWPAPARPLPRAGRLPMALG